MPAALTDLLDRIRRNQSSLGIELYPAASATELLAFERKKGIRLPADVRAFYQFCNGFESAEDLFRLIPLGEILARGAEKQLVSPHDFHLAEYLFYCDTWTLAVNPLNPEEYAIYNTVQEAVVLTNSFTGFLEAFLDKGVFDGLYDWRELRVSQLLTKSPFDLPNLTRVEELDQLAESVRRHLNLQYDAEGVKYVAGFIERMKVQLAPEEWPGLINSLGAFLGRCIILNFGGSWQSADEHGICVAFDELNKVFPLSKTTQQFENGLEDSICYFYTVIPVVFKLPPLASPAAAEAPAPPSLPRKPWNKFW